MSFVLVNARVFTGTGEAELENAAVVVEGSRIGWVGPASEAPHGEIIDCTGKTILPGLVDAHAHLTCQDARDPYTLELAKPLEEAAIDAVLNAAKLLRMGFTSIRDVGTRGNTAVLVREAVAAGRLPGPRIKAAKQIISVWGGLGDFHPTHIFRRQQYSAALTEIVTGPWEARNAVRQQVKDGVDWIKVEASGTGLNPLCPGDRDTMSFEELRAVVEEAEDKGRPVACHAESRRSIVKAARAGVRTIEHAVYLDDEGTEAVLEADIAICPTLALYTMYAEKGLESGILPEVVAAHRRTHESHVQAIRKAYDAGVTIVAGSDSGVVGFPQGGGLEEICAYVEAIGMSEEEAVLTATRNAARVIGFDEAGTLEPGKVADLLVFAENPLERIRVLTEPEALEAVVQDGVVVAGQLPLAESARVAGRAAALPVTAPAVTIGQAPGP
jgi:imidazolonepropionase-like amidohydrolase